MLIRQNIFFGSKIGMCAIGFYADSTGIFFIVEATKACVQLVQCGMPSKMPAENEDCKKNWGFSLRLLPPPGRTKRSNQKCKKNALIFCLNTSGDLKELGLYSEGVIVS